MVLLPSTSRAFDRSAGWDELCPTQPPTSALIRLTVSFLPSAKLCSLLRAHSKGAGQRFGSEGDRPLGGAARLERIEGCQLPGQLYPPRSGPDNREPWSGRAAPMPRADLPPAGPPQQPTGAQEGAQSQGDHGAED